jgi:hypothetical protein
MPYKIKINEQNKERGSGLGTRMTSPAAQDWNLHDRNKKGLGTGYPHDPAAQDWNLHDRNKQKERARDWLPA